MNTRRTYVDIHVLQTVPPSNLNRDDAGSPKQATYGGVRRARVSSQAWKRATRIAFTQAMPREDLATRTRKISTLLAERIRSSGTVDQAAAELLAAALLKPLGITDGKKTGDTAYLLFFGYPQLDRIAGLVRGRERELAGLDAKTLDKELKNLPVRDILAAGHPMDVALFGRMIADIPALNVDAATQVAHALSTHAAETEFDYFTAVDDENPREETGAGMIGTIEFNSATLYRFATVELSQLARNLDGDAAAAATALSLFLRAFVTSMPAGHQNSFGHRTMPGLVTVAVRGDQPVNLVTAFEEPVRPDGYGIERRSAERLARELQRGTDLWGLAPLSITSTYRPASDPDTALTPLGPAMPFADLIAATTETARQHLINGAA